MSKFNAPLFRKLIRELKLEQKKPTKGMQFDMRAYGDKTECGTSCCAMGTGVVRGVFPHVKAAWGNSMLSAVLPYDREISFGQLGTEAFGISETEYDRLFVADMAMKRDLPAQIAYMEKFLASKIGHA